jgi:ribosomal protein S18 acetylase RimI-like enzyme
VQLRDRAVGWMLQIRVPFTSWSYVSASIGRAYGRHAVLFREHARCLFSLQMNSHCLHTARPITLDDLPAVARLHRLAFPDSALTALGAEAVRRYYHWQLTGPHEVVALCIEDHQKLTAFCFGGIFRLSLLGFLRNNRRFLLYLVATRPWVLTRGIVRQRIRLAIRLLRRRLSASPTPAITRAPKTPTFGVLSIAVDPSRARAGQGTYLMDCLERAARERSFSRMDLTVSPDNHRAIRFYERLGWSRDVRASGVWSGAMRKDFVLGRNGLVSTGIGSDKNSLHGASSSKPQSV